MSRARLFAWIACVAAACGSKPSVLDDSLTVAPALAPSNDPWATATSVEPDRKAAPDRKAPTGGGPDERLGFDLPNMLSKVAEGTKKPGPYEAPDKSADYDVEKPHVGVLALGGNV